MNYKKLLLVFISAFIGLSSAIALESRVTFTYVQISPNYYIKLLGAYNQSKCTYNAISPCEYTVGVDLGMTVTKATLTAAGARGYGGNKLYI
ncbi:hypothetical protein [Chitinophaga arvensicola]|uniref:Uncharacterized protein n=1 Tax=Chitinophaga arvensicola TaxID=29529 RepID=A0A1I0S7H6_9BACT|nr:hypothetical protein [Chitinophaga arvensicola]SEW51593.1 hypothetical protein SAMN04488122_4353 [Chitinophaga arvensicola]